MGNRGLNVSYWTALNSGLSPQKLRLLAGLHQGMRFSCLSKQRGKALLAAKLYLQTHIQNFGCLCVVSAFRYFRIETGKGVLGGWLCGAVVLQHKAILVFGLITNVSELLTSENQKPLRPAVSYSTDRPPATAASRKAQDKVCAIGNLSTKAR